MIKIRREFVANVWRLVLKGHIVESTAVVSTELLGIVGRGDIAEISGLLDAGANPNFQDVFDGSTCLHRIAAKGHLAVIELLLSKGADPNLVTQNTSASPLGVAALAGQEGVVDLLIANGAKLSQSEIATGLVQECRDCGHARIAEAIESMF